MILIIGILLLIFLGLFSIFFPAYYISELVLSFLPYMLLLSFLGFLASIILLRNKRLKKINNGKYVLIMPIFVLLFGLMFFLTSRQYNHFYTGEGFENTVLTGEDGIDILYSNILYTNDDYQGLYDMIQKYHPEMIFMVEFTDEHNKFFQDKLKKDYPYSARINGSKKYFGGVVFSKFPIKNLTSKVDQGAWRYSYFKLNHNHQNYYIYLIHTSSPVTYQYFQMRNRQFDIIAHDYLLHQKDRKSNDKVIMLGDFNVSPWSKYYKDFASNLSGLDNVTSKFSNLFTWELVYLPFLQSHIDHVFVSKNIKIGDIEKVNTPGSDHKGLYLKNVH